MLEVRAFVEATWKIASVGFHDFRNILVTVLFVADSVDFEKDDVEAKIEVYWAPFPKESGWLAFGIGSLLSRRLAPRMASWGSNRCIWRSRQKRSC